MTTQVDQNREDERISQDTATPTAGTNQADNLIVLFLDIDGVVNKQENFDPAHNPGPYPVDAYCAFLVGKIQLDTGCQVVLSSSWRHHPDGVSAVEKRIVKVMDITPTLAGTRGDEVQAWLDKHPEVTRYAIVDDDSDFYPDQPLFKTTFKTGLTDEIAKRITEHLNATQEVTT